MIQQGQLLPTATVSQLTENGMVNHNVRELFAGKKVVLFAVPGAFTPTCSERHLPGFISHMKEFTAKGVDIIACISVNDAFVMKAWGAAHQADKLMMLADGDASFTSAIGLESDSGLFGGIRSKRYAMVIEDGRVSVLNVEAPKSFEVSKAEAILAAL